MLNKVRIVSFNDEKGWETTEFLTNDIELSMAVRGFHPCGYNNNKSLRPELRGLPRFDGLNGAMWDGDAVRYESPSAYKALSA